MTEDDALTSADLQVEGVLSDASNLTARVLILDDDGAPTGQRALYKPVQGEAPLRDFPDGTLGRREVAAHLISVAGGWDLIPLTLLRDGPLGPGSVQRWVDWEGAGTQPGQGLLEVFTASAVPPGWLTVVHGEDAQGAAVAVAHRDSPELASMAILDAVLNNADRKGAHLVLDAQGHLWGFDHGLTLHVEDKLRTVLWGWAGEPVPEQDLARLRQLRDHLVAGAAQIRELISAPEVTALGQRVESLLTAAVFPALPTDRYPLPWPLW